MGVQRSKGPNLKRAGAMIKQAVESAGEDVAQEAYDEIKQRLGAVLRNPTGHYESRIQVSTQSNTMVVTDGGVIYGPWLEGVSSRNSSTQFKGYSTFRRVLQSMDQKAETVADKAVSSVVRKI